MSWSWVPDPEFVVSGLIYILWFSIIHGSLLSQHSMCTLSCLRRILRFCLYLYSSVSQSLSCSHVSLSSVHVLVCLMCPVFPCPVFSAFSFGSSMSDYVWLVPAVFPSCFPPPHILCVFSPLPIGELSHVAVCFLMCLGFLVFSHLFYIAEEVDGFFFTSLRWNLSTSTSLQYQQLNPESCLPVGWKAAARVQRKQ